MRRGPSLPNASSSALVFFATLCLWPVWSVGYLRDDWLLLWKALDPSTAPVGAAGVFPRPVAEFGWRSAAFMGGDAPWAMHLVAVAGWGLLVALLLRELRSRGRTPSARALAAAWVISHGALVEPRLWAAASNGVWAFAFALGALALHRRGGRAHLVAGLFWSLAVLTRADALALFALLPLPAFLGDSRRARAALVVAAAAAGALLLAWMLHAGGGWTWRLPDSGRALRLLVVPWGPELGSSFRAGSGWVVLGGLAGSVAAWVRRPSASWQLASVGLALLLAHTLVSWSAAGRYLIGPVIIAAMLLADGLDRRPSGPWRVVVGIFVLLALVPLHFGRTTQGLRETSALQTSLYQTVRERVDRPTWRQTRTVHLLDLPATGLDEADLENVVSTALRRSIEVETAPGPGPTLRWGPAAWVELP